METSAPLQGFGLYVGIFKLILCLGTTNGGFCLQPKHHHDQRKSFETGESLNVLLCWACAPKRTCFTSFHCTSSLHSASLEGWSGQVELPTSWVSQRIWNREILASARRELLKEWLCLNTTKDRGREAGGQRDLSKWEEPSRNLKMLSNARLGQPSLHTGMCSLGLAGHQLCRKGSGFPWIINELQCTSAARKANRAVLGSCGHSAECSLTVLLSSKEATPAEVSQCGHPAQEGSQQAGEVWQSPSDGGGLQPVMQEEWLWELGSFWLGEGKVKEQGSEASHCLCWDCSQGTDRYF